MAPNLLASRVVIQDLRRLYVPLLVLPQHMRMVRLPDTQISGAASDRPFLRFDLNDTRQHDFNCHFEELL